MQNIKCVILVSKLLVNDKHVQEVIGMQVWYTPPSTNKPAENENVTKLQKNLLTLYCRERHKFLLPVIFNSKNNTFVVNVSKSDTTVVLISMVSRISNISARVSFNLFKF